MPRDEPVAIVGVSALFPGSSDLGGFWRDVLAGRDLLRDVPPTHWRLEDYYDADPGAADRTYGRRGAFLDPVEFAPLEFGIPPAILPATDTAQLLALLVARQVLDDAARGRFAGEGRDRISVILGVASATELVAHMAGRLQIPVWRRLLREAGLDEGRLDEITERAGAAYAAWQENTFPGLLGNVVAGRIANRFDLGGTNCVVDAACASSLAALQMALGELHLGHSDVVITGGVDALNDVLMYVCFSKTTALSPTGDCRPFSDQADGTMLGEGLGMVALKRLADAERDGDHVYALIRGMGTSSDGRARSVYAPDAEGQAAALRRCYERAGYGPDTVELVEAHGTATQAGDAAELQALRAVFDATGRADRQWCALGSVKSQIGHTKAAAGIAGLLKATLALHHKVLPPTIKVGRPNPALELPASPFYLNTTARPWIHAGASPRRAAVSSFGFGGTNFHVTLEEYVGPADRAWRMRSLPSELLVLGAGDAAGVAAACEEWAATAEREGGLARLARRAQRQFDPTRPARLAVVARHAGELALTLRAAAAALRREPSSPWELPAGVEYGAGSRAGGEVVFLFPGQGSQYVGMGAGLAMAFDAARRVWDRAAALSLSYDRALHEVVFPRPAHNDDDEEREAQTRLLTATEWAQPAVGAHSLAVLAVLRSLGVEPAFVGGHSFGELTALHAAGVIGEADFLRAARRRGELMAASTASAGAMIAVAVDAKSMGARLAEWGSPAVIANLNGPAQTVLSGSRPAIEELERRVAEAGWSATRLAVSTAFHSPLMEGAAAPFRAHLESVELGRPGCPVYSNAEAAPYPEDAATVRDWLAAQITRPVRFADEIERIYEAGGRTFVEVGPQDVLTRLVGQCLRGRPHLAVGLDQAGVDGITALWSGLGKLAAAGVPLAFERLWDGFKPEREPPAEGAPRHTVLLTGANYGKPRPSDDEGRRPAPILAQLATSADPARESGGSREAWLQALAAVQGAAADAHETYQRTLTESHNAFLAFAEQSMAALARAGGLPVPDELSLPAPPASRPPLPARPAEAHAPEPPPQPLPPAPALEAPADAPDRTSGSPPLPAASSAGNQGDADALDPAGWLLQIVADHTGYPQEMLNLGMQLEGDLGIDSIKRVEILAALQVRAPGLKQVGTAQLAQLRTLGDIVSALRAALGVPDPATPAAAAAETPPPPVPSVPRAVVRAMPAPVRGLGLRALRTARRIVLTDCGTGVAAELAGRLADLGRDARVVDRLTAEDADADAVIVMAGLRPVTRIEDALAVNRAAFEAARTFARSIGDRPGVFVTVQDTGGDFGLGGGAGERAWLGGLSALAKTVAQELPAVAAKAVDIDTGGREPGAIARQIADELWAGGPELEVGLRASGERLTVGQVAEDAALSAAPCLDAGAVIVASGGARGVTAAALIALARRVPARFVLLGRTPEPGADEAPAVGDEAALRRALIEQSRAAGETATPRELERRLRGVLAAREVRETVSALESLGAQVRYRTVDVRDAPAVAVALAEVRRAWGPIRGLVHGAGVVADAWLRDKADDAFDRVFDTKVLGLRALLEATRQDPLALLCVFSSVAARAGNPGQSDYAMANEVLNQVATAEARRRGPSCQVRSLNWGPWAGGMVSESLAARFRERGVALLDVADGAAAFVREALSAPSADVAVVLGPAPALAERWGRGDRREPIHVSQERHPYLAGHCINGRPVLPLALVVEWFCAQARAARPEPGALVCRDVRVLRGIRLEDGLAAELELRGELADSELRLWLLDQAGRPRFQGRAVLNGARVAPAAAAFALPTADGVGRRWTPERIYGPAGVLFHGPAFHVVDEVSDLTDSSATARLRGTREMGWPGGPWTTDPAALDGCLQVAVLWASPLLGAAGLPMAIEEYVQYHDAAETAPGMLACTLRRREVSRLTASADIRLVAPDGRTLAELRGVEVVARPS